MDDAKELLSLDSRIHLLGDLDYISLLSLYKRSSTFIHLAYLDHCPNVVVDAQAAGCHVVCSSSGGTSEIVSNGTVIEEKPWDYKPTKLYSPPSLFFENKTYKYSHNKEGNKYSILECSKKYLNLLERLV